MQKKELNYDVLVKSLRNDFQIVRDRRAANIVHTLPDILMSAYAIFALKYPSLLCFEQQNDIERENLNQLFGITKICSDAQMRRVLDEIKPSDLDTLFSKRIRLLKHIGVREDYRFLKKYYLCSVDGVHYFESKKIKCNYCQVVQHQNKETSYHHAMLGAVLVHPNCREVFPIGCEGIKKQDGKSKNDCELSASKRLQAKLGKHYGRLPLVMVEDALYANEPHIELLDEHKRRYIIGVKPGSHTSLFNQFEGRRQRGNIDHLVQKEGAVTHHFYWMNNVPLNGKGNIRVNFLYYEEHKKGKVRQFSWVTSFRLRSSNVKEIMEGGRARWKIENETFNTLKNQGYHFEHNYGHGSKHLCDNMAKIMLLAFLIDQIIQASNRLFNAIWKAARAKKRVWERIRAIYLIQSVSSFKELFRVLARVYKVQLE